MCKICTDWEKGKMTSKEAMKAIGEIIGPASGDENEHYIRLAEKIVNKEVSSGTDPNPAWDEEWERNRRGSN
jgi:hypothetical protein